MKLLSELVTIITQIPESRLLPDNPIDGDIPCFDANVVVGSNDETVKFLLQPVTSNKELVDSAYGNPTKVVINNHGLTVDDNGAVVFTTSTYGTIAANMLPEDVLVHDKPWVIDLLMKLDEGQWNGTELVYFGREGSVNFWFQWTDNYKFECNYDGNWTGTELGNLGEEHLVTLEYYQDTDSNWYVALYLDGTFRSKKQVSSSTDMRNYDLCIGRRSSGKSPCSGQFKAIRIRAGAPYKGQTFTPDEFPYREPQTVGKWGKINKNELVTSDSNRLLPENPTNGDIPYFDITATVGGGIDNDTHLMLHFDEESGIPADSSQDEILVTANDTAADAATAKFGKARNLNNSYLSLTCPAMSTGTGDFTYEGWFYFNELNKRRGLFGVDMGLYVALWGDNTFGVAISTSGSSWNYNHMDSNRSEATATQGVWQHIALVRNKGNVTLYLNGNSILSFDIGADTVITGNMGNNPFRIGYPLGGMSFVADFCDEFRFSTVARWTGNFTPPDAPYSKPQTVSKWSKFNKSELALKSDLPSPREDVIFTSSSLSSNKLIVENATVGTFAILDNSNSLVIPNMKQVDTSVEIDFTGWTVTGNWTIKFAQSGGGWWN